MGGPEASEPECYTTLAFVAANTERVKLTAMVSGVHFRHPGVLAKMATTLDVLSGGRAWLGVGSGHYEEETRGLGIPFPPQRKRFEMLEETVRIAPCECGAASVTMSVPLRVSTTGSNDRSTSRRA